MAQGIRLWRSLRDQAIQLPTGYTTRRGILSLYRGRAGVEGTISQGTRTSDLRRSRYIGLAKTRLLHLLIATALNFMRLAAWLADTPHAQTRRSAFAKLAPVAA